VNAFESGFSTLDELRDGIARVHVQAAGALDVDLFEPNDAVRLLGALLLGSTHAAQLLRGVTTTAARVERLAGQRRFVLSMCCPRAVRILRGVKIGLVAAAAGDATDAIGFVRCGRCSSSADGNKKITNGLQRIWPDVRPIVVTYQDGSRA
jgi:hypothetical protein